MENIKYLIILLGKRFTGKDYIGSVMAARLQEKLHIKVNFVHATTEVKRDYATYANLDLDKLCNDRNYKEAHREAMTLYSRGQMHLYGDLYYNKLFREKVLAMTLAPTIYIVDVRHKFEIDYYLSFGIPIKTIKVNVDNNIKAKRGWIYNSYSTC